MNQIAMSMGMAIILSFVTFLSKMQKGEGFDVYKALRTLIIGVVIGGISWQQDFQLNNENWESYLTANMGVIAFLDQGLKVMWGLVSAKKST